MEEDGHHFPDLYSHVKKKMEEINPQKYTTKERKLDPTVEKEVKHDLNEFFKQMNKEESDMIKINKQK